MTVRGVLRWAITAVFSFFVAAVLVTLVALNVERLAEQEGWDKILLKHWGPLMSELALLLDSRLFWAIFGFFGGATVGMWLDTLLRRREPSYRAAPSVRSATAESDSGVAELIDFPGVSAEWFARAYKNNTHAVAETIVEPYIGKKMRVAGSVRQIIKHFDGTLGVIIFLKFDFYDYFYVHMHGEEYWDKRASFLRKGERISATGVIRRIAADSVTLVECEFLEPSLQPAGKS